MAIRISVKGLAKFMTSTPARQRKILRDYKFPKPEGVAQAKYYAPARSAIHEYHAQQNDRAVLKKAVDDLNKRSAMTPNKLISGKLDNNVRAIECYMKYFSQNHFDVLPIPPLQLVRGNVLVTATPDLFVTEKGRYQLIKLELGAKVPRPEVIRIITQVIFEATDGLIQVAPKDVLFLDVIRGTLSRGARIRTRLKADIDAACRNIEDMWPNII